MTGTAALISEESDSLNQVEHIKSNHRKVLDIIPGVSGGMARVLVGQPFDTIKTRMQVLGAGTIGAQGMPESMVYKNNMDCMRKMITNEGPMSLYKGTVAPLLGNMVLLGIHFPTFQKVRKMLDKDGEYNPTNVLIAGGAAGAAGSLVSCSSELIRTKMQMQRKAALMAQIKGTPLQANGQETYNSSMDCVRKIFRHHGIRGLFSGYASTLARDIQGYAWFFLGYEATVQAFLKHNHAPGATKADLSFLEVLSAGIVAGFGLWGSMFPIDTIKSKIQADSLAHPQFKGTIDCIRQSVAHEGAMGMWRGVGVALLRAIPVNGAIFLAVEGARKLVDDVSDHIDGWDIASAPQAMPASQAAPSMGSQTATA